jgi:hypothetical protein
MKRKQSKPHAVRVTKPSPHQAASAEFRRTIKDCSTAELDRIMIANGARYVDVRQDINGYQRALTIARHEANRLQREHAVLTAEIEGRR